MVRFCPLILQNFNSRLSGNINSFLACKVNSFWPIKDKIVIGGTNKKKRKVIEAIAEKINNIVNESNGKLTVNKIASKSCLTQSTVQHIMDKSYKDVKLLTIVRLCDGLGLTLKEFFSDELFDNIDRDD